MKSGYRKHFVSYRRNLIKMFLLHIKFNLVRWSLYTYVYFIIFWYNDGTIGDEPYSLYTFQIIFARAPLKALKWFF